MVEIPDHEQEARYPNTNPKKTTGAGGSFMLNENVVAATEPYARKFVGLMVEFDLARAGGKTTRERGEVVAQKWLGVTERGRVPEYEVTVRGRSGRAALVRVTRDHVVPI